MLSKNRYCLVGLLLAVLVCLSTTNVFAAAKVVARVGSVPITVFEHARELQKLIPLSSSFHSGISQDKIEKLKDDALATLVERAYMVQFALNEEIAVSADEIDAYIAPVRQKFASDKDFKKALGEESVADFRLASYRRLLADKAFEVAVKQKIKISEADINTYYNVNKNRFMRPRQFRASHILLKVDPSGTKEAKAERLVFAKELVDKARAGEDFYNLAYYNSDDRTKFVGGDMGTFHEGQVLKEIEDAILKMKVGDVSDPIESIYGFSIVKLVEDNPPKQLSYEDVKVKLIEQEKQRQQDDLKKAWMDALMAQYKVEHTKP